MLPLSQSHWVSGIAQDNLDKLKMTALVYSWVEAGQRRGSPVSLACDPASASWSSQGSDGGSLASCLPLGRPEKAVIHLPFASISCDVWRIMTCKAVNVYMMLHTRQKLDIGKREKSM